MSISGDATLVDLFCGAGGLSLGLVKAGFQPICAIDSFPPAVETYRKNFGDHVRLEEVLDGTNLPKADVIAGGPPCQGFSSAGLRREGDKRNSLVGVFAGIVEKQKPEAFIFENVEGFLTTERGERVLDLLEPLLCAGYRIHFRKINAANYGVPQHRKRVLVIGGLGWDPSFPEPTHNAFGAPGASLAAVKSLPSTPTVGNALQDLPVPSKNGESPTIPDHSFRPLSLEDMKRAMLLKQGHRMRDLPEEFWHESYKRRAYRRVMDGTPTEKRGGAPAGVRRLRADEPCKAITSGARTEFLHPTEHRNLTLRECARLQTFPDSFEFCGSISDRAILIGNAVPPCLADIVGRSLIGDLKNRPSKRKGGKLLSFVPTLSEGMSPALRQITDLISEKYLAASTNRQMTLWH